MSINHLSKLQAPPIEKIKLGREYEVTEWFLEGIEAIASARPVDQYPVDDLAKELGWETTAKILWVRGEMQAADQVVVDMSQLNCYMFGCSEHLKLDQVSCNNGHNLRIAVSNWNGKNPTKTVKMEGRIKGAALRPMKTNSSQWKEKISKTFALESSTPDLG